MRPAGRPVIQGMLVLLPTACIRRPQESHCAQVTYVRGMQQMKAQESWHVAGWVLQAVPWAGRT